VHLRAAAGQPSVSLFGSMCGRPHETTPSVMPLWRDPPYPLIAHQC
jgi:hypothetical protein